MEYHFLPCRIKRGGFSSERAFVIPVNGGDLVGTANVQYLRDGNHDSLSDDQPPPGTEIPGFVQCRVVRRMNDRLVVEVPSTDLVEVSLQELVEID